MPLTESYLLTEDGDYWLTEDGFYVIIDEYDYHVTTVSGTEDVHGNFYYPDADTFLENTESVTDAVGTTPLFAIVDGTLQITQLTTGTTIIDGTSNMFKILASGSRAVTIPNDANDYQTSATTLTALGTFTETPGSMCYLATGNNVDANQHLSVFWNYLSSQKFAAATSGGAVTSPIIDPVDFHQAFTDLDGSNYCRVQLYSAKKRNSSEYTVYQKYYILKESAM